MSDGNQVRLVSAGTGRSIEVPDTLTLAQLRELANISPDVNLSLNGSTVDNEDEYELNGGETIVATPSKVGHGF